MEVSDFPLIYIRVMSSCRGCDAAETLCSEALPMGYLVARLNNAGVNPWLRFSEGAARIL